MTREEAAVPTYTIAKGDTLLRIAERHYGDATTWPAGKFRVEVWLDGASKGSREFEMKR